MKRRAASARPRAMHLFIVILPGWSVACFGAFYAVFQVVHSFFHLVQSAFQIFQPAFHGLAHAQTARGAHGFFKIRHRLFQIRYPFPKVGTGRGGYRSGLGRRAIPQAGAGLCARRGRLGQAGGRPGQDPSQDEDARPRRFSGLETHGRSCSRRHRSMHSWQTPSMLPDRLLVLPSALVTSYPYPVLWNSMAYFPHCGQR